MYRTVTKDDMEWIEKLIEESKRLDYSPEEHRVIDDVDSFELEGEPSFFGPGGKPNYRR